MCLPSTARMKPFPEIVSTSSGQRPRREVLARERKLSEDCNLPLTVDSKFGLEKLVLAKTPIVDDDGAVQATKLSAVFSLRKPFKPAALLAAVAGCLESAERRSSSSIPAADIDSGP